MALNHLAKEKSPYLKQHTENPVMWHPWGEEAFAKAKAQHKPIFLSIGYSTCHWCHVMAHESFEDESTADFLNQNFISIKVDKEERPDIDHIYMNAVIAITGQGGWPLSVFLKPDATPFFGGTYFPPVPKWGAPSFKNVLASINDAWSNNPAGIESSSTELLLILKQSNAPQGAPADLDTDIITAAVENLSRSFDEVNGGFSNAPKFPMGHTLSFLLGTPSGQAQDMVKKTLATIGQRGIYDQLAGGVHRYATDAHWQVPHFEKMLYDQALLALSYVQCYQRTQDSQYSNMACSMLDYCLNSMRNQEGGFYSAYDADSDGKEGAYYVFSFKEITEALGQGMASIFNMYYGVKEQGNVGHDPHGEFAFQNILHLVKPIAQEHEGIIIQAKALLLNYRAKRYFLHCDDKVLTSWNGLMIETLAYAGAALKNEAYIQEAKHCYEFILKHMLNDNRLFHRFAEGSGEIEGMLEDYAFFICGILALYEVTGENSLLDKAKQLTQTMQDAFEDKADGGFFMSLESSDLILRPMDIYDGAIPSGNAKAAAVLVKLFHLTDNPCYAASAKKLFNRFWQVISKAPQGYTSMLPAYQALNSESTVLKCKGPLLKTQLVELRNMVYTSYIPGLTVCYENSKGPVTYQVCRGGKCGLPMTDLTSLKVGHSL